MIELYIHTNYIYVKYDDEEDKETVLSLVENNYLNFKNSEIYGKRENLYDFLWDITAHCSCLIH